MSRRQTAASSPWPTGDPREHGIDPGVLEAADAHVRARLPGVYSMLVVRHGRLLHERYYRGMKPTDPQHVRSVTKSFTAVLVGIAMKQGLFRDVGQLAADFMPELVPVMRPGFRRQVTIADLLRMTSDVAWSADEWLVEAPVRDWHASDDWLRHLLTMPGRRDNGPRFRYCSGDTYLLSVLLSRATGRSALEFARTELFGPLGIGKAEWPSCPGGYTTGHVGLQITARDLAKLGQLVVSGGVWNGERLYTPEWASEMTRAQSEGVEPIGTYGYGWWVTEAAGCQAALAIGAGGQYIVAVPELELVVTVTAKPRGRHWASALPFIKGTLIPAVRP